jgi:Uma2 family endonuclease
MSITTPITAEQLYGMPDDGLRRELIQGEIIEMNPAGFAHGDISARLARLLGNYVEPNGLGVVVGAETGFILARDPDTVRAPDAGFVRRERVAGVSSLQKFFPGPPDLAVEVLSPDDRPRDVEAKIKDWLDHGTLEVWSVDPRRRTATVHRPSADPRIFGEHEVLETPELLAGLRINVADIFPKP